MGLSRRIMLLFGFGVLFFLSLQIGASGITLSDIYTNHRGIFDLRLSRTLSCFSVGACLALSGLILQTVLDNPLAEPYTLGISGGATLGALLVLLIGITPVWAYMPVGSLVGSVFVTLVLFFVIPREVFQRSRSLVLFGLMISLFCGSLVVLLVSVLEPTRLSTAIQWTMGFAGTERDLLWPYVLLTSFIGCCWVYYQANGLDSFLLGDGLSSNLKSDQQRIRKQAVVMVCFLTGISVAVMGLIGFVGLIAPHIATTITKSRRVRQVWFEVLLIGGMLLLLADVIGRFVGGDNEVPAGSLTALMGAPLLILLMMRRWRHV